MSTTLLQVPRRTFGRLRVLPQVSRHLLWRLRGVPQVSRHLLWRLRESRKSPGICFGVCGSPASLPAFALAFAGVPQVSRYLLWRLRESRKSPGICFGVCGESRKCFGEPVGRYSMLSMTFSIRVSHSFVELTLSYDPTTGFGRLYRTIAKKKEKGTAKNKFHSAFSITV